MISSDDSDSEESHFWMNWKPSDVNKCHKKTSSIILKSKRFGNWIPPKNFGKIKKRKTDELERPVTIIPNPNVEQSLESHWGNRFKCDNFSNITDEGNIWMYLHPGTFGTFKVWVNHLGHFNVHSEAEVDSRNGKEKILVVINVEQHLRELLEITETQWNAIKETLLETKTKTILYESLKTTNLNKLPSLDKLWSVVCRRRHGLKTKAILMTRNGVYKMQKLLEIIPKFNVIEIKHI